MKKYILSIMLIGVMTFTLLGCGSKSLDKPVTTNVENSIEDVNEIFACVEVETLASNYEEDITGYDDLTIDGGFAGIEGVYNVNIKDNGDIYEVVFKWDATENKHVEEALPLLIEYLGECDNFDESSGYYEWNPSNMHDYSIEFFVDDGIWFSI